MQADFHTHILPRIDDGSRSRAQSLEMLRLNKQMGIRDVVLTPHFYPDQDHPDRFLSRRSDSLAALKEAAAGEALPRLIPGAEVHYFPNISSCDALPRLAIGTSRYVLVEMPMCTWTDQMYRELEMIRANQGLTPIIAHLDRYLTPFNARHVLHRVAELPVLVQVNGSFFLDRRTARLAMRMLKRKQIHLLGSDCHNMDSRRPNLGMVRDLIQAKLGREALDSITYYERQILGEGSAEQ